MEKIILQIEGEEIVCRKEILMNSSPYFKAMFSSSFIESRSSCIALKDVKLKPLKCILSSLENGSKEILKSAVECIPILECASMLQFTDIQTILGTHLQQLLNIENCLMIENVANKHGLYNLSLSALTLALYEFLSVVQTEFCLQLPLEEFCTILSHSSLNLYPEGEWAVWKAILKWIQFDETPRKQCMFKLLHCLSYHDLSNEHIASIASNDIINQDLNSKELVTNWKAQRARRPETCIIANKGNAEENNYPRINEPQTNNGNEVDLERCDDEIIRTNSGNFCKMSRPIQFSEHSINRIKSTVPCVVCYNSSLSTAKSSGAFVDLQRISPIVFYFDPLKKKMNQLVSLTKAHAGTMTSCIGVRTCAVGLDVFVTGGQYMIGSNHWNNDVWSYSTVTGKWACHPQLPQPRRNHMTCSIGRTLYVMGGFGKHRIALNSVDVLDPSSGMWKKGPMLPFSGSGASVVFKDRVYVFGSCCLYSWDPQTNAKSWTPQELKSGRPLSFSQALVREDVIYLIEAYSRHVFEMKPDVSSFVKYLASFQYETSNVTFCGFDLFSFSSFRDEDTGKVSSVIEVLPLCRCDEHGTKCRLEREAIEEEFVNEDNPGSSKALESNHESVTSTNKLEEHGDGIKMGAEEISNKESTLCSSEKPFENIDSLTSIKSCRTPSKTKLYKNIELPPGFSIPSDITIGCFELFKML